MKGTEMEQTQEFAGLIHLWQSWAVAAILLLIAELLYGGTFLFFFPLGLASATLSIVLFLEEELALLLSIEITDWRFELIAFACLSECYGLLINSLLRRSRTQKRDINRY